MTSSRILWCNIGSSRRFLFYIRNCHLSIYLDLIKVLIEIMRDLMMSVDIERLISNALIILMHIMTSSMILISEEEIDQIDEEHRQDDDNPDDIPLEDFVVNQLDEEEIQETKLNAISNSKSNSKSDSNKVKTCYRYAIYGDCILGSKCPNVEGHNPNTTPAARRWLIDKLSRQMNQSILPMLTVVHLSYGKERINID